MAPAQHALQLAVRGSFSFRRAFRASRRPPLTLIWHSRASASRARVSDRNTCFAYIYIYCFVLLQASPVGVVGNHVRFTRSSPRKVLSSNLRWDKCFAVPPSPAALFCISALLTGPFPHGRVCIVGAAHLSRESESCEINAVQEAMAAAEQESQLPGSHEASPPACMHR